MLIKILFEVEREREILNTNKKTLNISNILLVQDSK